MKFKNLVGLLMLLIFCSCSQRKSKDSLTIRSGLQIENGPTRGISFIDNQGNKYGLVYIKTTVTNDSTIPINLQIDFFTEYNYPSAYGDEQFKVILLPKEFALDGVEISDSLLIGLLKIKDKPSLNKTFEPNEKCVKSIGILRPSRPDLCSATPYAIMEYGDKGIFHSCEWLLDESREPDSELTLGLKVGFCTVGVKHESCTIIPCGQISYPENLINENYREQRTVVKKQVKLN